MWPVFICFIAYLICLSPLIGLWHKLDLPFLYSNEPEEKCESVPPSFSFFLHHKSPSPRPLFPLHLCLIPSMCFWKHTHSYSGTLVHISYLHFHLLQAHFWHPFSGVLTFLGCFYLKPATLLSLHSCFCVSEWLRESLTLKPAHFTHRTIKDTTSQASLLVYCNIHLKNLPQLLMYSFAKWNGILLLYNFVLKAIFKARSSIPSSVLRSI